MSERSNPKISIVVPVYNVGATLLTACIESALAQTFNDFELILVDDASTDKSADICEAYTLTDPRVRLLRLESNRGLPGARNAGVEISRGEYLCFLDGDDRLHPSMLERLVGLASRCDAGIIGCGFKRTAPLSPIPEVKFSEGNIHFVAPKQAIADALYQHLLNHSAWGKLYRRQICIDEPFRPGGYEDLRTFYHMFLRAGQIAWTSEPLYLYTENPASYLHTFNPARAVVLDVTGEIVDYMERNMPELVPAARDRALSAAFNILNLMTVNRCDEPAIAARCRSTIRRYRLRSLMNRHVRLKNKIGILTTYLGGFGLLALATRIYPPK